MQEMKYFNEGNDCDICKNQLMTGRDGTVEDCRRRQNGLSCRFEERDIRTCPVLQIGLENTIVFETRACDKMEEIRLNLKEFYAVYKGVEFKIYDACPMFTDDRRYQLKCRAGA